MTKVCTSDCVKDLHVTELLDGLPVIILLMDDTSLYYERLSGWQRDAEIDHSILLRGIQLEISIIESASC